MPRYIEENEIYKLFNARGVAQLHVGDIDVLPRVDAVEVVHGRWLKLSPWNNYIQSCLCLNCESISYQKKSGIYIGKIPNYCPNCGAKMDGG